MAIRSLNLHKIMRAQKITVQASFSGSGIPLGVAGLLNDLSGRASGNHIETAIVTGQSISRLSRVSSCFPSFLIVVSPVPDKKRGVL